MKAELSSQEQSLDTHHFFIQDTYKWLKNT